jgi:hypothetical protein
LADKTRHDRENNRAYPGHEPSEAHTTAVPVDLGAPSDLIGAHEPMSIEAALAAPIGGPARGYLGVDGASAVPE